MKNFRLICLVLGFQLITVTAHACSAGAVNQTIERVRRAGEAGDTAEVARTVSAITAGALGGLYVGLPSAPATGPIGPALGAIFGAACGCGVSNLTANPAK